MSPTSRGNQGFADDRALAIDFLEDRRCSQGLTPWEAAASAFGKLIRLDEDICLRWEQLAM